MGVELVLIDSNTTVLIHNVELVQLPKRVLLEFRTGTGMVGLQTLDDRRGRIRYAFSLPAESLLIFYREDWPLDSFTVGNVLGRLTTNE